MEALLELRSQGVIEEHGPSLGYTMGLKCLLRLWGLAGLSVRNDATSCDWSENCQRESLVLSEEDQLQWLSLYHKS